MLIKYQYNNSADWQFQVKKPGIYEIFRIVTQIIHYLHDNEYYVIDVTIHWSSHSQHPAVPTGISVKTALFLNVSNEDGAPHNPQMSFQASRTLSLFLLT